MIKFLKTPKHTKKSIELIEELNEIFPNSSILDVEEDFKIEFPEDNINDANNVHMNDNSNDINNTNVDSFEDPIYIKIHEDLNPQFLIITFLNAEFIYKIISYKSRKDLGLNYPLSKDSQLVLSNFRSPLGMDVAESLMELLPPTSNSIKSNQVVNFKVHKDFIYFRMYRFAFTRTKSTQMEQIGPQLTLRIYKITEIEDGKKKVSNFKKYIKNRNLL